MKETDFAMWVTGIILGLTIGGMALLDFVKMMMEEIKPDELMDKEIQQTIHHLANMDSPLLRIDQTFFKNHIYEFTQMAFLGERTLTRREILLATEGQIQQKHTKKAKESPRSTYAVRSKSRLSGPDSAHAPRAES